MKVSAISQQVNKMVSMVINGCATQYYRFENEDTLEDWTIRVGNHNANNSRVNDNTISFVVNLKEEEENDTYSALSVNKESIPVFLTGVAFLATSVFFKASFT